MSKKVIEKDGKQYVEKKPFYKRIWFWVLVIVLAAAIGGALGGNGSSEKNSTAKSTESTKSTQSSKKASIPIEYQNALNKAKEYSDNMYMSKQGIYDQLVSKYGEKFSKKAATYAINHLKADWNYNALQKAKSYQKEQDISRDSIKDQLTSSYGEKFTEAQAEYEIKHLPK